MDTIYKKKPNPHLAKKFEAYKAAICHGRFWRTNEWPWGQLTGKQKILFDCVGVHVWYKGGNKKFYNIKKLHELMETKKRSLPLSTYIAFLFTWRGHTFDSETCMRVAFDNMWITMETMLGLVEGGYPLDMLRWSLL